jgi:hypothetical protein
MFLLGVETGQKTNAVRTGGIRKRNRSLFVFASNLMNEQHPLKNFLQLDGRVLVTKSKY